MRVIEKGPDRVASAHVIMDGEIGHLKEYGEYVDSRDGAICCYVAVEEGHKIKIDGRFFGPTLTVAYDVLIDGVCRKANAYIGKTVQQQKNKKLIFDTFLVKTADGTIDTGMLVSPVRGPTVLEKATTETVGSIELRVYVTRQFGIEHEISNPTFDSLKDDMENGTQSATYKDVAPQFRMTFEENCSTLENREGNRERKKVYAKRPGKEPWAIFRFHYRSEASIMEHGMEVTFDAKDKTVKKREPHDLELDPVPVLEIGSKPAGNSDGDNSVRTSSPPPPETPSTPSKFPTKSQLVKPKVLVRKPQSKPTPSTTTPTLNREIMMNTELVPVPESMAAATRDLPTTKQIPEDTSTPLTGTSTEGKNDDLAPASTDSDSASTVATPPRIHIQAVKKASEPTKELTEKGCKPVNDSVQKFMEGQLHKVTTANPQEPMLEVSEASAKHKLVDAPSATDVATVQSTIDVQHVIAHDTKDAIKNGKQSFISPLRKAATKLAPINTEASTLLKKPGVVPTFVAPPKRAPEGTLTPPPDGKRIKTDLIVPLTPFRLSRPSSALPSPPALSIEAQVTEQRKQLETMRQKRADTANKKALLDERMAPYKQRMAEELERLRQEMAEEEELLAEEEHDYEAKAMMLEEFEQSGPGT